MRRDDTQRSAFSPDLDDDRAPMAMPRQIKDIACCDLKVRVQKKDRPQKAVTAVAPPHRPVPVDVPQSGAGLDPVKIKDARMRGRLIVCFCQGQYVMSPSRTDIADQHLCHPVGIHTSVLSTGAVDVPCRTADVGRAAGWFRFHRALPSFGSRPSCPCYRRVGKGQDRRGLPATRSWFSVTP
jgi:hypothetical protein